jgi:hypothetical protein
MIIAFKRYDKLKQIYKNNKQKKSKWRTESNKKQYWTKRNPIRTWRYFLRSEKKINGGANNQNK